MSLWGITCRMSRSPCRLPQHRHHRVFSTKKDEMPTASQPDASSVPSRTVFPWRHENHPVPRLIPGTIESKEAPHMSLTAFARKFLAYGVFHIPFWQVLMGQRFEKDLADSAAYAFGQAVAGIASNVYRIPFAKTQQNDEGSIQFTYDPSTHISSDDRKGDFVEKGGPTKFIATEANQRKRRIRRRLVRKTVAPKRPIPKSRWMYATSRFSSGVVCRRSPRQLVLKQVRKHEVAKRKRKSRQRLGGCRIAKSRVVSSSAQESSGPLGTYCSNVSEMVSPQLLEFYRSARARGKDQVVHLNMEPLGGHLISMTALPFCSRRMAKEDPASFRLWHKLYPGKLDGESFKTIHRLVSAKLGRDRRLDFTIEMQVLVPCSELFHVTDRDGTTTQGKNKATQVMHFVRLEATVDIAYEKKDGETDEEDVHMTTSDWIVTDIDDLVGHKTWYHL